MLPRFNRIPSQDIRRILRRGDRVTADVLDARVAPNTAAAFRAAIVISRKVDTRATHRNRMRRLLQEALHRLLPRLKPGYDMVILVRRPVPDRQESAMSLIQTLAEQGQLLIS